MATDNGTKTRHLDEIIKEMIATFDVHRECGTHLGGVHLELTGENVTECIGGSDGLTPVHLGNRYETFCDPRLNYTQSLDVAFLVAKKLKEEKEASVKRK